jgi:hypothetical protein
MGSPFRRGIFSVFSILSCFERFEKGFGEFFGVGFDFFVLGLRFYFLLIVSFSCGAGGTLF